METTKCPNCRAIIPALSNICEYCDTMVEASSSSTQNTATNSQNSSDKPTLDSAIHVLEHDIIKMKSVPAPSIRENLKLVFFTYFTLGFYLLYRKIKSKVYVKDSFESLESIATKNARNLRTYYGDNARVKELLQELENEIKDIKRVRKEKSRNTNIGCFGMVIAIILFYAALAVFSFGNLDELQEKLAQNTEVYNKIDDFVASGNYNKAEQLAIGLTGFREDKKAIMTIREAKINKSFDEIKNLILNKKYDEAELLLIDINWLPVYDLEYKGYDKPKALSDEDKKMEEMIEKKKESLYRMLNQKRSGRN